MLFNRDIEPRCSYCRFGSAMGSGEFACSKRGIMLGFGSCGSFKYEPTKRIPEQPPAMKETALSEQDFAI